MENDTKTMRSVIWRKLVDLVDDLSLGQIGMAFLLAAAALFYSAYFLDSGRTLQRVMEWKGGAVPMIIWINLVIWNLPRAWRWVTSLDLSVGAGEEIAPDVDTIEGAPTARVVGHLVRSGTFKRADIEAIGVPRQRYAPLADRLQDIGILSRGENNARELAPGVTAAMLAQVFAGARTAGDLQRPINIVRPNPLPSPAPLFTRREVSQTA